ncbi:MAG: hypothetical protein KDH15_15740 [Rhodocyclaceae bacterium]|nr:hypothetical protein [Rhodocyclaceae bacterium]
MQTQFVIEREPVVTWPVTVELPRPGGRIEPFRFVAVVRVLSEDEYETIIPAHGADDDVAAAQDAEIQRRTLRDVLADNARVLPRLITGWQGVTAPAGGDVPIAELPAVLTGPYGRALSVALWRAIHQVRYGIPAEQTPGAAEGNSAPSPAAG